MKKNIVIVFLMLLINNVVFSADKITPEKFLLITEVEKEQLSKDQIERLFGILESMSAVEDNSDQIKKIINTKEIYKAINNLQKEEQVEIISNIGGYIYQYLDNIENLSLDIIPLVFGYMNQETINKLNEKQIIQTFKYLDDLSEEEVEIACSNYRSKNSKNVINKKIIDKINFIYNDKFPLIISPLIFRILEHDKIKYLPKKTIEELFKVIGKIEPESKQIRGMREILYNLRSIPAENIPSNAKEISPLVFERLSQEQLNKIKIMDADRLANINREELKEKKDELKFKIGLPILTVGLIGFSFFAIKKLMNKQKNINNNNLKLIK